MDVYGVSSWAFAILMTVTMAFPLTILLAAAAYKLRLGTNPIPLESNAFWLRSTFTALGLAVLAGIALGLDLLLSGYMEFPAGPVHLILFLAYLPVGVWYTFWMYALDDLLEGLSIFTMFVLLPGIPLLLLGVWFNVRLLLTPWLLPAVS